MYPDEQTALAYNTLFEFIDMSDSDEKETALNALSNMAERIATTPELLEALETFANMDTYHPVKEFNAAQTAARAAIEKAKS